jgi:hypothetical protein
MDLSRKVCLGLLAFFTFGVAALAFAQVQQKPNILVISATGTSVLTTTA